MSDPPRIVSSPPPQPAVSRPEGSPSGTPRGVANPVGRTVSGSNADKMICERCGKAEMYRMHAVWRCPECGFKTDCCGW
jgi:predicted RNA-binding Zn-ribbon protein involved in translation (DUF1610 family)